ncbi:hypothetical protein AJ78_06136 [Emergomyces pasteurianus Ep9510]|uniref:Cyclase n=1 Tax=Emergomyces pasteurianus Ep9510 TaxID=1447872 RepID=A0A1J9PBP8_9EURO|nr:hypothetical protein AJ78_06136 [Emergomyces pasteurianus Ep9510]
MTGRPTNLPKFSDLPLNKEDPLFSAWGLYGKDDQLGFLNRQTDAIVAEAAKEIKTGVRVSLNWPLDAQNKVPFFNRQVFHKQLINKSPRTVNDDIWAFNTQSSSQWDGLRHFGYQKEKKFYNGVTMEDIHERKDSTVNGIHAWAEKGIVGRGVLLDFHRWALANNISAEIFKRTSIPLKYLKAVAESQGVEIKFGDILIIRVGYMTAFKQLSTDELENLAKQNPPNLIGVERSEEMLEWIWENFSAVAGDHPAFESYPAPKDWSMHEVLLAGWGCPIGELFDLDKLAEECDRQNRWSFFVSSEVCNVPGGVAR